MDWKEIVKNLILILSGSLLPALWSKFLNRGKEKREAKSSGINDCEKNIKILSDIITKLEAEVKRVESQMNSMQSSNLNHEEALKNQIRQLREVNETQSAQIDELNRKIGILVMEKDKAKRTTNVKKKSTKGKKPPRKAPSKAVL